MPCPNCPGAPVEYDNTTGSTYCTICGTVLEESTITSEITFVEGGDGSARMVGQFVGGDRSGLRSIGMRNRRLNAGQSREETIANARRKFQEVSIALKGLGDYHIDRAVQCYKLALMHGFTHGRKQNNVIAACLYTVCRQEKTMHMLIDFSDVLHTNVFTLGNAFLKLTRLLNIRLPLIDPSLYLARFAAQLEFGDKTNIVTNDALRLIQRMKRDWIHYGRRPSGLCGACLLIAARIHGFRRTQTEIIKVVKICDVTLRKRLNEFAETPSAELSIDDFRITDLSAESNPPSFKRDRAVQDDDQEIGENVESEMSQALNSEDLKRFENPGTVLLSRVWTETAVDEDPSNWNDLRDEEFEDLLLDETETETKRKVWEEMNSDWSQLQEAKRIREEQGQGTDKKKRKQTRKPRERNAEAGGASYAREVIAKKMAPVISKKINYAALDQIFD